MMEHFGAARFVLAYAVSVVVPGLALTGWLCPATRPLERWTLSLLLGMVCASASYWLASLAGQPGLVWLLACVAAIVLAFRWRQIVPGLFGSKADASHAMLAGVVGAVIVVLLVGPTSFDALAVRGDGTMTRPLEDFEFHAAIVTELARGFPPQAPFAAGEPLRYHYGADLVAALMAREAGLAPGELVVRLLPPVMLVQLVLAVFCCARLWLGSAAVAALVAALTVLGGDFSWVLALLCEGVALADVNVFQAPTFVSLYTANPMLPALGLLFGGLFALAKTIETRHRTWSAVAVVLFAALMHYKIFAGVHVAAALAGAGFLAWYWRRDRLLLRIAIPVAALALASLAVLRLGNGAPPQEVRLEPLWLFEATVASTCFLPSAAVREAWHWGFRLAFLLAVALPLCLVGGFGPRLAGLRPFVASLHAGRSGSDRTGSPFLAAFVAIGFAATALFRVAPRDEPFGYNNAVWFLVQAKYVAWLFVGQALITLATRSRALALGAALGVASLSFPSTLAWARIPQTPPVLDAEQVRLLGYLGRLCAGGAVVMAPAARDDEPDSPGEDAEIVALAGCRVPLAGPFAGQLVSRADWQRRLVDGRHFWNAWRRGALRFDILDRYGARHVVERTGTGASPPPGLRVLLDGPSYVVYAVSSPQTVGE
jgi:hypothetical protein